jgi:hypothetical protein
MRDHAAPATPHLPAMGAAVRVIAACMLGWGAGAVWAAVLVGGSALLSIAWLWLSH